MKLQTDVAKRAEGEFIVYLTGSLDSETYQDFEKRALEALPLKLSSVILDLRLLDYISSMGVRALVNVWRKIEERQGFLMMVNVPEPIQEVFRIIKMLPSTPMFTDVAEADRYFAEIQRQVKEKKH